MLPAKTQLGTLTKFYPVTSTGYTKNGEVTQTINTKLHCITCMEEYETKSLEELRWEDYQANRKGPQWSNRFGFMNSSAVSPSRRIQPTERHAQVMLQNPNQSNSMEQNKNSKFKPSEEPSPNYLAAELHSTYPGRPGKGNFLRFLQLEALDEDSSCNFESDHYQFERQQPSNCHTEQLNPKGAKLLGPLELHEENSQRELEISFCGRPRSKIGSEKLNPNGAKLFGPLELHDENSQRELEISFYGRPTTVDVEDEFLSPQEQVSRFSRYQEAPIFLEPSDGRKIESDFKAESQECDSSSFELFEVRPDNDPTQELTSLRLFQRRPNFTAGASDPEQSSIGRLRSEPKFSILGRQIQARSFEFNGSTSTFGKFYRTQTCYPPFNTNVGSGTGTVPLGMETDAMESNETAEEIRPFIRCLTSLKEHETKSLEEIRWEAYRSFQEQSSFNAFDRRSRVRIMSEETSGWGPSTSEDAFAKSQQVPSLFEPK